MTPVSAYDHSLSPRPWLKFSPNVQDAIAQNQPVLAFETTVLSFGLPHPANLQIGRECENIARQSGVLPATLGLVDGNIHVGISDEQMQQFCQPEARVTKVNLQNIAATAVRREMGALTVAGSMQVCSVAGIPVFSTGGIGGVHHDFAELHDVSSDMLALARYRVAVVCAGIKSILDVPASLEKLETLGVPVIGYQTDRMPLFYSRDSLYPLEMHTDDIEEVAQMVRMHWQMGGRGVLVVTPVPEEHAIDMNELQEWIASANHSAQIGRVTGKALTPFLLKKLVELSHGRSLTSNMAMLENNALVGSRLARVMTR